MVSDSEIVVDIAKILVEGLNADSIEDVGVTTVPRIIKGGSNPFVWRAAHGLEAERGALTRSLMAAGVSRTVARAVVLMHRQVPLTPRIGINPVTEEMIRTNLIRRSQYLLNAARRLQQVADDKKSLPGSSKLSVIKAIADILPAEQRYYNMHLMASSNREFAASRVDIAAAKHGTKLGWYTVVDERTSLDCLQAHGKNFHTTKKPAIGWPGTAHPGCRCYAGAPHPGGDTVYGIKGD